MRVIALQALGAIAALVFLTMLIAMALRRPARGVAEYLWAVVPWLIMAACVFPSVRRIVTGG